QRPHQATGGRCRGAPGPGRALRRGRGAGPPRPRAGQAGGGAGLSAEAAGPAPVRGAGQAGGGGGGAPAGDRAGGPAPSPPGDDRRPGRAVVSRAEPWALLDVDPERVRAMVRAALAEDIGQRDATTEAVVLASARASAVFVAKQELVLAGLDLAMEVF